MQPLDPQLAPAALGRALAHGDTLLAVADVDWSRFAPGYTSVRRSPLLSDLPEVRDLRAARPSPDDEADPAGKLRAQLAGLSAPEQERTLVQLVRDQVARVLGHATVERVEATRAFNALGFDSLMAVELRNRLGIATGLQLPATLLFDHPTARDLAAQLRGRLVADTGGGAPLLADLDRIEAALAEVDQDDAQRARIGVRLQALLTRWNGTHGTYGTHGTPGSGGGDVADDISDRINSAAADEIFDFIENDLGIS
nr:phosphopantetheine-binding protein [Peterkaempfera bronchialis]